MNCRNSGARRKGNGEHTPSGIQALPVALQFVPGARRILPNSGPHQRNSRDGTLSQHRPV